MDPEQLLVVRYNGINESPVFKNPSKLPAIVHFTSADNDEQEAAKGGEDAPFGQNATRPKECTEYQFTRNHMLESSSTEAFKAAMAEFVRQQTPKAQIFKQHSPQQ